MGGDTHEAWNTFWERNRKTTTGKSRGGGGCLPGGWRGIDDVQRGVWHGFAKKLDRGTRVLDLATGDGRVLANLLEKRRDLKLLGIDRATALPDPPRGVKLRGGVSMEKLPLPDNRFAAVTSQFGFEYGDIAKVAPEIARVLQAKGRVALMTHRLDGPIVAHNRKRREQIAWAIEERQLTKLAKRSLALRGAGIATIPPLVMQAPELGARLHGPRSAAWEIAEAIRQSLHLGRNDDPARVGRIIDDIEAQAANELGRIASLEVAATTASDVATMLGTMEASGFECVEHQELRDARSPEPFADFRVYRLNR